MPGPQRACVRLKGVAHIQNSEGFLTGYCHCHCHYVLWNQNQAPTPRLSFKENSGHRQCSAGAPAGLTCTVTTKIFTTCSISLKGFRPLARNLSQGLMKKYLRRRRRSSSSRGVGGAGEVPSWVPYPGLGLRRRSVSVEMGESSGDWAQAAKKELWEKFRNSSTVYGYMQKCC